MAKNFDEMLTEVFGAVDAIVDVRLQGLEFDKTVLCEIIDASKAEKGEYTVSDGVTSFMAYSKDDSFEKGESVYVTIPNNDFTQQKTIIGKYRKTTEMPYNYISPMESFIKGTDSYISIDKEFSILANGDIEEVEIWNWEKDPEAAPIKGYTVIGLSAKFKTWLKDFDTASGNYGLRLYVLNQKSDKIDDINQIIFEFDSSSMYGDVYNYLAPITQEGVFNISDLNEIIGMKLVLYQKKNFLSQEGELISYLRKGMLKNIFVTSPRLYFGYNVNDYKDGDVILLSSKNLTYKTSSETSRDKDIYARWILSKDQIIDSESEFDELNCATIHWYRYSNNLREIPSDLHGDNWFEMYYEVDEENRDPQQVYFSPFNNLEYIPNLNGAYLPYRDLKIPSVIMQSNESEKFQVIIEYPSRDYQIALYEEDPEHLYYQILLKFLMDKIITEDIELNKDQFLQDSATQELTVENIITTACEKYDVSTQDELLTKLLNADTSLKEAVYLSQVNYYKSNILMFYNESVKSATVAQSEGVRLEVDKTGYNGVYFLYDRKNKITTMAEAQLKRLLFADISQLELDGAEVEEQAWFIPIGNTMIDYMVKEDDQLMILTPVNGKHIFQETDSIQSATHYKTLGNSAYFKIKDTYNINYINNKIYFQAIKNGETQEASFTMSFGPKGSQGVEYTLFLMEFEEKTFEEDGQTFLIEKLDKQPLRVGQDNYLILQPKLVDSIGKEVSLRDFSYGLASLNDAFEINEVGNRLNLHLTADKTMQDLQYAFLTASAKGQKANGQNVTLYTYYPIVTTTLQGEILYYGTTSIMYDNLGGSPEYYQDEHKLFVNGRQVQNLVWEINGPAEQKHFLPVFSSNGYLTPRNLYMEGISNQVSIQAKRVERNNDGEIISEEIVFNYPLRIYQDVYSSSVLNSWDGKLTIDEKNGKILSSAIGAGKMDENNSFSGVFMGNTSLNAEQSPTKAEAEYFGIMGYNQNVPSFGFNIDGTAFIGKSSSGGQIVFDGNKGIIETNGYGAGNPLPQMRIDLAQGSISCESASHDQTNISNRAVVLLDPGSTQDLGLFLITDRERRPLFNIKEGNTSDEDQFFLQSQRYAATSGLKVVEQPETYDIPGHYEDEVQERDIQVTKHLKINDILSQEQYNDLPNYLKTAVNFSVSTETITTILNEEEVEETKDDENPIDPEIETITITTYIVLKNLSYSVTEKEQYIAKVWKAKTQGTRIKYVLVQDPNAVAGEGFKIDLKAGVIDAYSFNLNATLKNTTNSFLTIQTNDLNRSIFSLNDGADVICSMNVGANKGVSLLKLIVQQESTFNSAATFSAGAILNGSTIISNATITNATITNAAVIEAFSSNAFIANGLITASNGLTVSGGTFSAYGSGNILGNLSVGGVFSLESTLTAKSNVIVGNGLSVTNGIEITTGTLKINSLACIYFKGSKYAAKKLTYLNGSGNKTTKYFLVKV